jgi:hypothetical protein
MCVGPRRKIVGRKKKRPKGGPKAVDMNGEGGHKNGK